MANQDQSWFEKGVDIWLIRDNLALSFEERVAQHQNTLDFIDDLKEAGRKKSAGLVKTDLSGRC